MSKKAYKYFWIAWISAFFAMEGLAIIDKRSGVTLSTVLRWIFAYDKNARHKGGWYRVRRIFWLIIWIPLAIWIGPHIMDLWGW